MSKIAVFGMGYVGCVTACCLSRDGHQVIGVDVDTSKVDAINAGESPIAEPGLPELLRSQIEAGGLRATTEVSEAIAESDVALIAVGTPSAADGSVSTVAVERVVEAIGVELAESERDYAVVVRSTLLPGVLEEKLVPLLERASGRSVGDSLGLYNNPEFLRETTAIKDYDRPPFVVVGRIDDAPADKVLDLYAGIDAEQIVTDTRSASLVKYACNAYHALKVAFANEVGALAKEFQADGRQVMDIVCQDTILNVSRAYLRPGFAFGGSCLPKDVRALVRFAQKQAVQTEVMSSILPSNDSHLQRALSMIRESGHRRIGLVGLSFKAGTDDLRESPQVILAESLLGRGFDLKIYDPGVRLASLIGSNLHYVDERLPHLAALLVDDPQQLCNHADLLVLGTDIANQVEWEKATDVDVLDLRSDLVAYRQRSLIASS